MPLNDDNTPVSGVSLAVPVAKMAAILLCEGGEKCLPVATPFMHSKAIKQQWIAIALQVGQSNK
jgi:hypothetical protein